MSFIGLNTPPKPVDPGAVPPPGYGFQRARSRSRARSPNSRRGDRAVDGVAHGWAVREVRLLEEVSLGAVPVDGVRAVERPLPDQGSSHRPDHHQQRQNGDEDGHAGSGEPLHVLHRGWIPGLAASRRERRRRAERTNSPPSRRRVADTLCRLATLRQTRDYFDAHASDLDRDSLVDKWRAIDPMFQGVRSGGAVLECGAGTGLYTIPMLEARGTT